MGGHAFHRLYTPRIPRELYILTRTMTTKVLQKLFTHVVVPTEMPSKIDYGDIDFLVSGPLHSISSAVFDYPYYVSKIKAALNTQHGRKGFLTEKVMYFAIPTPGKEDESWIQIDVKVCEHPGLFEWERFGLNYASVGKIFGSMVKPLGLTINPEGLYARVEGLEEVNLEKSLVFLTREPREVLKVLGLNRRVLMGEFVETEELFEYLGSSWLFNPAHFAERMKDDGYISHLFKRSAPYVAFVQNWIPEHYPGYVFSGTEAAELTRWYKDMREAVKNKVFAMHPAAAQEYYEKRRDYLREAEEQRLRKLIMSVIPDGTHGWSDHLPQPPIVTKVSLPRTPELKPTAALDPLLLGTAFTMPSPHSPPPNITSDAIFDSMPQSPSSPSSSIHSDQIAFARVAPTNTPLLLDTLPPRIPAGQEFSPRPPTQSMSIEAKLLCLARWTLFDASGTPFLAHEPREKKFEMNWVDSGAEDAVLVKWAKEMWWAIWTRQYRVNYVGMWKKRVEKEEARRDRTWLESERKRKAEEKRKLVMEKLMRRLKGINEHMRMERGVSVE